MDARARQKEKRKLFTGLYRLDNVDNDEAEASPLIVFTQSPTARAFEPRSAGAMKLTVSAPLKVVPTPSASISMVENTPCHPPIHLSQPGVEMSTPRPGSLSKSFPAPESTRRMPSTGAKRKRGQSLDVLPDSQKIFNGLSFYFLRNNDIAPARRALIRKTLERGALWVKEWRDGVTHVIVDKDLCYNDVISFLKIPSLPPTIVLVNQTYLSDCIDFRFVANPHQPQYQVEGYKTVEVAEEPVNVDSSERSLSLKPDKSAFAQEPQTSSRTEESEQEFLHQALKNDEARALEEQRQISRNTQTKGTRDALDDAIAEVTTLKDLPMDLDEDEDEGSERGETADDSEDSHSEDERKTKKPRLKKASNDQQNFNCMHKHDGLDKSQNPNHQTIEILQQMANHYDSSKSENHQWKVPAYRRAISALRKQNSKITTKDQALAIPFIGSRLAAKIEEIVWTDRLRHLDNIALEPQDIALQLFLKIYGVGIAQASTWVNQGFRTLHHLTQHAHPTKNQETGIAHFEDFLARVPRPEIDSHAKYLRDVLARVAPGLQLTVGGSYRRGAPDSGDIDFVVTKPGTSLAVLRTVMTATVIPLLFGSKYLRARLATASDDSATGSKWHGAACLPGSRVWRRVDFLFVPWEEMGAAMIYFTGNDIFNRSMRLLARSEKRIFEILGVPYRPPEHRIC